MAYPIVFAVITAYVADLIWGDPLRLPHPVVGFGRLVAFAEKRFNRSGHRFAKGLLVAISLVGFVWLLFFMAMSLMQRIGHWAEAAFVCLFFFYGLANRTLVHEGRMVFQVLEKQGLDAGRRQLSRIVGRDTSQLSPLQIRTAVLETMAENLSDGVVAPLFWFAVGGLPAMMAYKMVNTLDSMIGYKNERYLLFGRAAARIDDVANFVPARLTAIMIALVALSGKAFKFIFKYGRCHSSPNSGYPEAAMAGVLNVRFGGPNVYHGTLVHKPFIGNRLCEIEGGHFKKAAYVNHAVTLLSVMAVLLLLIVIA
jgi:adenosylcobinamide-phosphate synthase